MAEGAIVNTPHPNLLPQGEKELIGTVCELEQFVFRFDFLSLEGRGLR